jgi:hypothetical protein
VSNKYDLPSQYIDEKNKYNELFDLGFNRTSTGQIEFTSNTSGTVYNIAGTDYDDLGQTGMMLLLKDVLDSYLITAEDFNNKMNVI